MLYFTWGLFYVYLKYIRLHKYAYGYILFLWILFLRMYFICKTIYRKAHHYKPWLVYFLPHFLMRFIYSGVHKSLPPFFSKILKKPSIVQKKMIPHINGLGFSLIWSEKKFKMADLKNSKWLPQKKLIFQLYQFSIFFHEIFMDWSLG